MAIDTLKRLLSFVLLCLAQVLVLNRIHLFGYATPLLYVYFVLLFPRRYPKWALLLGAIQPYFLELFVPRDAVEAFSPSLPSLNYGKFLLYSLSLVFFYCLVFFAIEAFTFFNWEQWLICSSASTLLTVILIMTLEGFKTSKQTDASAAGK